MIISDSIMKQTTKTAIAELLRNLNEDEVVTIKWVPADYGIRPTIYLPTEATDAIAEKVLKMTLDNFDKESIKKNIRKAFADWKRDLVKEEQFTVRTKEFNNAKFDHTGLIPLKKVSNGDWASVKIDTVLSLTINDTVYVRDL